MKLRIKELREELQLTQKTLAELVFNVQRNVSNWENGTSEPDLETTLRLADVFKVSLDELYGRTPLPPVHETTDDELDRALFRSIRKLNEEQKKTLLRLIVTFRD